MIAKRLIRVFIFIQIFIGVIKPSIAQDENEIVAHQKLVDSVFNSLSVTERINQLMIINSTDDATNAEGLIMEFGGIMLKPESKAILMNDLRQLRIEKVGKPVIVGTIGNDLGIDVDGVEAIISRAVVDELQDPHLFYESAKVIAQQCYAAGISFLDLGSIEKFFNSNDIRNYWKMSEFRQGLVDGGLILQNALDIVDHDELTFSDWNNKAQRPIMIRINEGDLAAFQSKLKEAIADDSIDLDYVNDMVKRVLTLKLRSYGVTEDFDEKKFDFSIHNLRYELGTAALQLVHNPRQKVPIDDLANMKVALVEFNPKSDLLNTYMNKYTSVDHYEADYHWSADQFSGFWNNLINYDQLLFAYHPTVSDPELQREPFTTFLSWIVDSDNSINLTFLEDQQLLTMAPYLEKSAWIAAPDNSDIFQILSPQLIFGGLIINDENLGREVARDSSQIIKPSRLSYTYPEAVGLDSEVLSRIDSIAYFAISEHAIPGCQVLVAKDNKVIYQESFGYHTYDSMQQVSNEDIYDLASVTKVSGALPGLMKLHEEGKFDLDATLGTYVKYFKRGDKKALTFREILAHQSGLLPWIPYWKTTLRKNGKFRRKTLRSSPSKNYPYEVAENLYLHKSYKKKIYKQIRKTELREKKYVYSGLIFYVFPDIIEEITGQDYEAYIYENFYKPLGATTLCYNPMNHFAIEQIVPTEYDSLFRKSQIHGKVHDEGAAMMEGVSSNAGLFANANDLAKLWQMYCNYGEYGGKQYLMEKTVREFTRCQYPENDNRRALGFDRPLPEPHENGNTAVSVSQSSFGHSGFTGTFAWADPEHSLVYIFLSNRVYPTRENTKLYKMNVRTGIQQVIYDAMFEQ